MTEREMASVWFDPDEECLRFASGDTATIGRNEDLVLVAEKALTEVPLGELAAALGGFSQSDPRAAVAALEELDEVSQEWYGGSELALVLVDGEVHILAISEVHIYLEPDFEEKLDELLAPIAERWNAELVAIEEDPVGYGCVSVRIRLSDQTRPVDDAVELARQARALMAALRDRPLDAQAARDLIVGGYAKAMEGLAEGPWVDVKRKPYEAGAGRGGERAKWEMAKDIAAFANAKGGIIVIPGTETQHQGSSVIDYIGEIPVAHVDVQRVRSILAQHIYPDIEDLEVAIRDTSPDHCVHWIYVPEQAEQLKPFLVHGAIGDDKVATTHVSLPRRVGAHTRHAPIAEIHAQLVAGRGRQLGREEILDWVRRDQLPWGFRELVEAAEAVGVHVVLGNGAMRFDAPDGKSIESQYDQVPTLLQDQEISRICGELLPYGLDVRRAPSGQLLPRALVL